MDYALTLTLVAGIVYWLLKPQKQAHISTSEWCERMKRQNLGVK